jgi:hypothetical protein
MHFLAVLLEKEKETRHRLLWHTLDVQPVVLQLTVEVLLHLLHQQLLLIVTFYLHWSLTLTHNSSDNPTFQGPAVLWLCL